MVFVNDERGGPRQSIASIIDMHAVDKLLSQPFGLLDISCTRMANVHVGATFADPKRCPGPVQLAFRQCQRLSPLPQWRMPASLHISALTSVVLA